MKKCNYLTLATTVCGLLLTQAPALAQTIQEKETNHPIFSAQKLDAASDQMIIKGVLGNLSGAAVDDVDFYYFHAKDSDVVTINIDGAWGGARPFDSILGVYKAAPGFPLLRYNDDASPDAGSTSVMDSRITNFKPPVTGNYVVVVSGWPRYPMDGGSVQSGGFENGDYTLVISGASPGGVQQINIDIKPGSSQVAPINPRSKGKIPVALLSSKDFDATQVAASTLTFGANGDEASLSHCGKSGDDVNDDGLPDLVCHFDNPKTGFQKGDLEGILRGRTNAGTAFEGRGLLKIVPEKRAR